MEGKDKPPSCPASQYVKRTPIGKHYSTHHTLCQGYCSRAPHPHPHPRLCCVEWDRLSFGHASPTSRINCFLFGKSYSWSTPKSTQNNMGCQTCTVTADFCLGRQNVSFKAGPSPLRGGASGFVETGGGLTFLITGQDTAAIDSPLTW